jgi:hypothetical protein
MSFDEGFLVELAEAPAQAKLQVIFIGRYYCRQRSCRKRKIGLVIFILKKF